MNIKQKKTLALVLNQLLFPGSLIRVKNSGKFVAVKSNVKLYHNELFIEVLEQNEAKWIQISELDLNSYLTPGLSDEENESKKKASNRRDAKRAEQKAKLRRAIKQANSRFQLEHNPNQLDATDKLIRNAIKRLHETAKETLE